MKRAFDLVIATVALIVLLPLILAISVLIVAQDGHGPFYSGVRVGRNGRPFRMVKFRSMRVGQSGAQSTAADDPRITRIGPFIRRFKLDEIPQLWNIIRGHMSFVGPRPNVPSEVALYSAVERELLSVRPGITDFASIVFADEGEILRGSPDPDRDYNLLIRPGKSRLGLHYIAQRSFGVDLALIRLTGVAVLDRPRALRETVELLRRTDADAELLDLAGRTRPLEPLLPPGVTHETWARHLTYAA
jgi:lipopolysaccharide/colanic/teichoic acid biosynthesis glycosyltransferase